MENKKVELKVEELEERIAPGVADVAICIVAGGVAHDVSVSQQAQDTLCARQIATLGTCSGL